MLLFVLDTAASHPQSSMNIMLERQKHDPADRKPPRYRSEAETRRPLLVRADFENPITDEFINSIDPKEKFAVLKEAERWSISALREQLIKIGAMVVRHGLYITSQMAEIAIPRALFAEVLRLIDGLRPAPLPP